jgi:hypothetical protein
VPDRSTELTAGRPDALFLSEALKRGARLVDRVTSICEIAEPILGGRAFIRRQPHGRLFITRSIEDTILFPLDHPQSGRPRYRWVRQADGSEWGYLVEGANA